MVYPLYTTSNPDILDEHNMPEIRTSYLPYPHTHAQDRGLMLDISMGRIHLTTVDEFVRHSTCNPGTAKETCGLRLVHEEHKTLIGENVKFLEDRRIRTQGEDDDWVSLIHKLVEYTEDDGNASDVTTLEKIRQRSWRAGMGICAS